MDSNSNKTVRIEQNKEKRGIWNSIKVRKNNNLLIEIMTKSVIEANIESHFVRGGPRIE